MDESEALQRLVNEFELTHQQAGDAVGRSRVAVSNLLRLLDLESGVKQLLRAGKIEMGHGRALLALPVEVQADAANKVALKGLSVRATEALVKQLLKHNDEKRAIKNKDPDIDRLQQDLSERLAAKVSINHSNSGKGKIVIHYSSLDELEGVLTHVK